MIGIMAEGKIGPRMSPVRTYRAGESLEDYCRACKTDRMHTVIAADPRRPPIRVVCGFCRSEHNYRGGPRIETVGLASAACSRRPAPRSAARRVRPRDPFPIVSDRERSRTTHDAPMQTGRSRAAAAADHSRRGGNDAGRAGREMARRHAGAAPGSRACRRRAWPIETFFHKIVMLRNRLRTLEQQVNAADLPDDVKVKLQGYVSGCYGSLTSFNVLFADEDDQFKGAGGD